MVSEKSGMLNIASPPRSSGGPRRPTPVPPEPVADHAASAELDECLLETFPASDPPSCVSSMRIGRPHRDTPLDRATLDT
jgi:hypothetical protein